MAEENVEIVRDVYERWSAGDFRAGDDVFDPLVLFVMRPEFPDAGTYLDTRSTRGASSSLGAASRSKPRS